VTGKVVGQELWSSARDAAGKRRGLEMGRAYLINKEFLKVGLDKGPVAACDGGAEEDKELARPSAVDANLRGQKWDE
jgi:hypothetical protein